MSSLLAISNKLEIEQFEIISAETALLHSKLFWMCEECFIQSIYGSRNTLAIALYWVSNHSLWKELTHRTLFRKFIREGKGQCKISQHSEGRRNSVQDYKKDVLWVSASSTQISYIQQVQYGLFKKIHKKPHQTNPNAKQFNLYLSWESTLWAHDMIVNLSISLHEKNSIQRKVNQQLRASYMRAQQTWQANPFTENVVQTQVAASAHGKSAQSQAFHADV